ncbi:MAG: glycosyltransferase [Anaerolineae bacterium]|nr:glycosyltransferase [Phycisphaerae bacterium]
MNFLIVTIGSHGDVHPFIGIAAALKRRGHDVTFMTNGHFESLAQRELIDFVGFGSSEDYLKMTKNKDLWSKRKGFKVVFGSVCETLPKVYEPIAAHIQANPDTILIGSSLALAARIAQDKFGVPMMTVHLAPAIFRSSISPPKLPGLFMPGWLPLSIKEKLWEGGDRFIIDPLVAPPLNAFRATLGLPPVSRVLWEWWNSPQMIVGLFPDWFAKPQADWPRQVKLTGFPLYDERGHEPLSREVQAFLAAGDKPIAFTPGSAMVHGHQFFDAAVRACQKLNRRGILLTRFREQIPASLPANVIHADYAPFSDLLPRVVALVHHGGIGTTSQALAAGVPQLITPMSHDQFDNVFRVKQLGVGDEIRWFRAGSVARKLNRLLTDPAVASACREARQRFAGVDGIEMTCDLAESLSRERSQNSVGAI